MATSHIISPNDLFLTRTRSRAPRHSTPTDCITHCRCRRYQPQQPQRSSHPPSLLHDPPVIFTRRTGKAIPSTAWTKGIIIHLGQNLVQGYRRYLHTSRAADTSQSAAAAPEVSNSCSRTRSAFKCSFVFSSRQGPAINLGQSESRDGYRGFLSAAE